VGIEKRLDEVVEYGPAGEELRTAAQVIIDEARVGLPAEIACQIAGVSLRTYRSWLAEGRAVLGKIAATPDVELNDREKRIAQFATDVSASLAMWVSSANSVLQRAQLGRQRTSTRTKTEVLRTADGTVILDDQQNPREVEVERIVTVTDEPIELGPLQWRLSKLAPAVYGPVSRLELTGAEGGPVVLDIGARVAELLARTRGTIRVEDEELEPAQPELGPGEPEVAE
jgi:hypothetical protein